jgi:hypothetical protein
MPDEAIFTDVLSLRIDTDSFASDLGKIEQMFSAAIGRMSDTAKGSGIGDIFPAATLQSLQDSLTELGAQVNETTGNMTEDFATMSSSVTAELENINAAAAKTRESLQAVRNGGAADSFSATKRGGKRASIFGVDPEKGIASNFLSGMTMGGQGANGIAALAGYMVTMETIGAGLFAVIQGITSIITAIPHALMEGVHYLETFQQDSSDLQGVLASNVKFSGDFATNFKMAGESAQFAVAQLRDNAVKANLDPKQLQNSFKALVDSGAGAMTSDVDQLVQLTTQFALAMRAAGKSTEGTRALISEIPKLMMGTEAPSSKLLQTLDLTKAQWEQLRQHALEHKDLLAELAPILAPYIAQVKAAQANHEELTKQLDRQKQVIESAFAAPVLKEFDTILRGMLDYLSSSKNSLELLANTAGQLVAEVLKLGSAISSVGNIFEGHPFLAFFAEGLGKATLLVEAFRGTLTTTGVAAKEFWKAMHHPTDVKGWETASANVKAVQDQFSKQLMEDSNKLDLQVGSVYGDEYSKRATDAESAGKNHSFSGGRVPLPTDKSKEALAKMREEFAHGLEEIKSKYGELLDSQKQSEQEQTETVHAGTEHRAALRRGELDEAQQLLDQMRAKYGNVKGAPDKLNGMQDTVDKLKAEAKKQGTADQTEDSKNAVSIDQMKYATQQKMAEEHYKVMGEIFKRSAQEGLMSYEDAAKAEISLQIQLYTQARNALLAQRAASGFVEGTSGYQKYTDQLNQMDASQKDQRSQDSRNLTQGSLKDSQAELQAKTAKANLDMDYAKTVQDGVARQKAVNGALAERLKADEDYLAAVRAANPNDRSIPELQAKVGRNKEAQVSQYNDTHLFQHQLDSGGNEQKAGFFSDIAESSKALSQAFAILEQTTKQLISSQGNLFNKISAGAGGASSLMEGLGDSSSGLGKLGSALGMSSSVASALPGIGAAVGVVGSVVGMIGQMFAQQAKNIANDVQKKFDSIMQDYQNNTASFTQTMQALQQEQQNAIQQLSGVKGGAGYLSQILLQVQQTEAALKAQAVQAQNNFEIQTATIQQSTKVGQQWMQTWASIEQQVHDYLYKEGGNTGLATQYQNYELAAQAKQIQDQYNQGLQTAVQDNYTLNSLMMSRQQIQLSILQLENSMSDSIERRQAPALGLAAQQTKLQLQQLQQQLSDTNNQINIEQQKVTAENQVFGLTTDINALHAEDATLQMAALNEQLANYKEMYSIIQSIRGLQADPNTGYFNGNNPLAGLPTGIPGFGATNLSTPAPSPVHITGPITIQLDGGGGSMVVATSIANELANLRRFGMQP